MNLYVEVDSLRLPKLHFPLKRDVIDAIKADGQIITPILVTKKGCVIDGCHRFQAAFELGLKVVPVRIVP